MTNLLSGQMLNEFCFPLCLEIELNTVHYFLPNSIHEKVTKANAFETLVMLRVEA